MHPGETFCIPARLSSFRRDSLPILTGAGRSSAILASFAIFPPLVTPAIFATPAIFKTLAIPVIFAALMIRSFECHFLNGKKIHADRRQGDRREDFERALNRGPREFSRSSEEPCAVDAW